VSPATDTPTADTCVCGSPYWHKMVDTAFIWCRRCGALRRVFESVWQIPLDRAGDIASSVPKGDDETPTAPGVPRAKRPG
jgi:hypothetical protein